MKLQSHNKELLILSAIRKNSSLSQRELAKETDISLGLINVIIKKMIQGGLLQASRLNKRKMNYCLTPIGLAQISERTSFNANDTIRTYKKIRSNLANLLQELYEAGYSQFSIHGNGELKELLEDLFVSHPKPKDVLLKNQLQDSPETAILNLTSNTPLEANFSHVINVLERIRLS